MKYVIISDLHSNLEALTGFQQSLQGLRESSSFEYDKLVCLGDIAGYGANPNEVVEWVRDHCDIVLGGNHDFAIVGKTDTSYFNTYALKACNWTAKALTKENKNYLVSLPAFKIEDDICWAHSSPFEPEEWHYIENRYDGQDNFPHFEEPVCFVGHSHRPVILEENKSGKVQALYESKWKLKAGHRYIINVGSLGQPRDGNPEPAFAIYDAEAKTCQISRFQYDIRAAQEKIKAESLPTYLADRLEIGK